MFLEGLNYETLRASEFRALGALPATKRRIHARESGLFSIPQFRCKRRMIEERHERHPTDRVPEDRGREKTPQVVID